MFKSLRKPQRTVKVTTYSDKTRIVEIDSASLADVHRAVSMFRARAAAQVEEWENDGEV